MVRPAATLAAALFAVFFPLFFAALAAAFVFGGLIWLALHPTATATTDPARETRHAAAIALYN